MSEKREAPWLEIAAGELGIKEIMGLKHQPRILEYHKATSLKASEDETPWCSAFVNWVMLQHGVKGTDSALARSWLAWGVPLDKPYKGCVIILRRGTQPWQGHVGFYLSEEFGVYRVLGGNQGNAVSIKSYNVSDLLGFRGPVTPGDKLFVEKGVENIC